MNLDSFPDLLIMTANEFSVWFNDGSNNFPRKNFGHRITQGWAFAACRIGGDSDIDVFVAQGRAPQGSAPNGQDFTLFNNGPGNAFTRLNVGPVSEPGNADWVSCLPNYQGTGHALVYVTNGRWLLEGQNRAYVFSSDGQANGPR